MTIKKPAPDAEVMTTRDAAAWWGCTPEMLRYYLTTAGMTPVARTTTTHFGQSYFWRTRDVLAVYEARQQDISVVPAQTTPRAASVSFKARRAIAAERAARDALRREQQRARWAKYWREKVAAKDAARAAAKAAAKVVAKTADVTGGGLSPSS